jgi:hypothetical protein
LRHAAGVAARGERLTDAGEVRLCLVIDQLEELFTAAIPKPAVQEFTRLVTLLARSEVVWVIATLRSDFYHRLDETPDLLLLAERGINRVKAPLPAELGQMIYKPAQLAGLRFEKNTETGTSLDAVLQDDAVSDPTALPLLEFALTELWTQRNAAGVLTFDAYERMGRMTGAIAERAEGLIATLTPGTLGQLSHVLGALVTVGRSETAPTAATVNRSRVATTPERAEILDKLIDARLVITDDLENRGDPKCRLAHERLIETWPRLRKLADADRNFLEVRGRLQASAETWNVRQRHRDLLLPAGTQLAEGEATLKARRDELDPLTIDFIDKSLSVESAQRGRKLRNTRAAAVGFGGLSAAAVALLVWNFFTGAERDQALANARTQAERASRGFAVAIDATSSLARTTGTSGQQIERVFDKADLLLTESIKERDKLDDATSSEVNERRASLLLSFAETSERLGSYDLQRLRLMSARAILHLQCGDDTTRPTCRTLFADTYEAEGNHLWRVGKPKDAVKAYQTALELRPQPPPVHGKGVAVLAKAQTEANLARAYRAAGEPSEAMRQAEACLSTAREAQAIATPSELQNAEGRCHVEAASALLSNSDFKSTSDTRLTAAMRHAEIAKQRFIALLGPDPTDVVLIARLADATKAIASGYQIQKAYAKAATALRESAARLDPAVRANPQNDALADTLQHLYDQQDTIYSMIDRDDLAAIADEQRAALAKSRSNSPRLAYWRDIHLAALNDLRQRYHALGREKDALAAEETRLALMLDNLQGESKSVPYPTAVLQSLLNAGHQAIRGRSGIKAADYYSRVVDHAERHLAAAVASGQKGVDGYSNFNNWVYASIVGLSTMSAQMVPREQRIGVLERVAGRISRAAQAEPRLIPYRNAEARILHELATAYDDGGDIRRARDAHERASNAGYRPSTIALRRWYQEGYNEIAKDERRAKDFELRSKTQLDLPTWRIEVMDRESKKIDEITLSFGEPDSAEKISADEAYRIAKFENVEITDAGRDMISKIYALARDNKESVASLLKRSTEGSKQSVLPASSINEGGNAVLALIKDRKLDEAYRMLASLKDTIVAQPAESLFEPSAWATLLEGFELVAIEATKAKSKELAERAQKAGSDALERILAQTADGSSPQLALALTLESIAERAEDQAGRERTAVRLYDRAIAWRAVVRTEDPKNANCACIMANGHRSIRALERRLGNIDAAQTAELRALRIYEDLALLEPEKGWNGLVVTSSQVLGDIHNARSEWRSALQYARKAALILQDETRSHSADSDKRIQYAAALEKSAGYAWSIAGLYTGTTDPSGRAEASKYFAIAVTDLKEASAIRESVLAVDPERGECRCQVGTNFKSIARIYRGWGKADEWETSLRAAVASDRLTLVGSPDYAQWKFNLATKLKDLSDELSREDVAGRTEIVELATEAADLFRQTVDAKGLEADSRTSLKRVLLGLSFNRLFVKDPRGSLSAATEALGMKVDIDNDLAILTNKAHALMYLGEIEAARALYIQYRGAAIGQSTWEAEIVNDFASLKALRLSHPLMDEILPLLQNDKSK